MLKILYEDPHILVVVKPAGIESQSARSFEPDMVSEIKKHIHSLCTENREPYVGVIHRLDKPVSGVMVYGKTRNAASALSRQVQNGEMKKTYRAVLCGKPVDIVGNYVDYLLKEGKSNVSKIVDKGMSGAKRAELTYRVLAERQTEEGILTLAEIELLTGRHHQIRVQFAGHGTPLWGDRKYNPRFQQQDAGIRADVALSAYRLSLVHPQTKKRMTFEEKLEIGIFREFSKQN